MHNYNIIQEQKVEQKKSISKRFLKMAKRIFLKEQVRKKKHLRRQKEGLNQESSYRPADGEMNKRTLWNRLTKQRERPIQTVGKPPAVPK